jgi:hypothetical protein
VYPHANLSLGRPRGREVGDQSKLGFLESCVQIKRITIIEQEEELIKCILNPIYFIETYLTIFDQTQGVAGMIVPFKLFDFQIFILHS